MIQGRDIVIISTIEWDFLWQTPQEIAIRFARAGNRVLYIENTGVREPGWRDRGRVIGRLWQWIIGLFRGGVRRTAPNLMVCSPLVLPPFGSWWRRTFNRLFFLSTIRRLAARLDFQNPLLWTFLPTDTAVDLVGMLHTPFSVTVYYCVADFSQLTPHVRAIRRSEDSLADACDLIFVDSPVLTSRFEACSHKLHVFPPGVDLDVFSADAKVSPRDSTTRELLRALDALPRPIIGYSGGLHRHVDVSLLARMARARPQWSWVCVGPVDTDITPLRDLANVVLLEPQPHRVLPHFLQRFDVAVVPYVRSPHTDKTIPNKIAEYLALGKPVVSTHMSAVARQGDLRSVIRLVPAEEGPFVAAIEDTLKNVADPAAIAARQQVARAHDWRSSVEMMSRLIERVAESRLNGDSLIAHTAEDFQCTDEKVGPA